MTERVKTFCDVCKSNGESNLAEEYCPQCADAYCSTCKKYHKLLKATKIHQTITIDEYNNLPGFIREMRQHCEEHGDLLEFYCGIHEKICCKRCLITIHKSCKSTSIIEDFLHTTESTVVESLEKTLQDIETNITAAIEDRRRNLEEIGKKKELILKEIKSVRVDIENHLNKLEKDVLQKMNMIEDKHKQKITKLITDLEKHQLKLEALQNDIKLMKKNASATQTFAGTQKLETSASDLDYYIQKLYDDHTFKHTTLVFEFNEKIKKITRELKAFGEVYEQNDNQIIRLKRQTDVAAQISASGLKRFNVVTVNLLHNIDVKGKEITSCIILQNDEYLVLDYGKLKVAVYKNGGLTYKPVDNDCMFDVTKLDHEHIAVTSGGSSRRQIRVIDIKRLQVRSILNAEDFCYGVTKQKESLYFCAGRKGIMNFHLKEQSISNFSVKFETLSANWRTYITSSNDHLYLSDHNNHSVTCFERNGQLKWKYQDPSVLREPKGITIDIDSNVYVVGSDSNNVVMISPDGKKARQLLGPNDNLVRPQAIYYDKESSRLLICNYSGPAFVYEVK